MGSPIRSLPARLDVPSQVTVGAACMGEAWPPVGEESFEVLKRCHDTYCPDRDLHSVEAMGHYVYTRVTDEVASCFGLLSSETSSRDSPPAHIGTYALPTPRVTDSAYCRICASWQGV